ncbi:hypothetical protein [Puniceibacterium sp. IMCC21224]|uniref:hypothetical protein n=1 Tax=Puniceibacterium sp. IMCC21224 TaxID=1618204 RepID=UPI00064D7D9C|nr:hypothetical protein [Puniceibacterium sp. IMCC21224]KMK65174.1 4,5-dihydroxyphthalate decarboxylase [Puniceibacterium sp. IMCC21224]
MTRTYPATGPLTLSANIASYPTTKALLAGEVSSDLVTLENAGLKQAHAGFKAMLREQKFDVSEMAVATYLQAREFGKGFSLLPVVVLGRFQHHCIGYNADFGTLTPQDLPGKRVAVRSYTQTTGLWVRGILQNDYGVDPDSVTWVCFDQPHLTEYTDPRSIEWGPDGTDPVEMLMKGEVDAGILGMNMPDDPRIRPLIPDPHEAAKAWYAKEGLVPPNHFIIVPDALCEQRPDAVRAVFDMLVASRNANPSVRDAVPDAVPVGVEANRRALECAIKYAYQQHIISKPVAVDDLFNDFTRTLGA